MAVLSTTHPTLLDRAKMEDPDGTIADIVPILNEYNEMLPDFAAIPCNDGTTHRTTYDTALPTPTWRTVNGGVQPSVGETEQLTDGCGMLYALSEADKFLADLGGQTSAFRMNLLRQHMESMAQTVSTALVYENAATNRERFTGLAARFASQSTEQGENILTDAATPDGSDNTSIWLVGSSPRTVHLIYPKGMAAGLKRRDYGECLIEDIDGNGGRMPGYREMLEWHIGLVVRDWRYVVRIQYDLENVTASGSTGPILHNLMRKAVRRLPSLSGVNLAFYMNRDSMDALDLQSSNVGTLAFQTVEDAQGKLVNTFMGIPLRRVDSILSTETGI